MCACVLCIQNETLKDGMIAAIAVAQQDWRFAQLLRRYLKASEVGPVLMNHIHDLCPLHHVVGFTNQSSCYILYTINLF